MENHKTKIKDVLLVHGGPGMDDSYFFPYLNGLKDTFNLHHYHMGQKGYSIEDLISELRDQALKINGPFAILGHSFGSALTLEYYNLYPSEVQALILVSAIFDKTWSNHFIEFNDTKIKEANQIFEDINNKYGENEAFKYMSMFYVDWYFDESYKDKGYDVLSKIKYNYKIQKNIENTYFSNFDCTNLLENLKLPILLIRGHKDRIIDEAYTNLVSKKNSLILSKTIPNSGHFPFIEQTKLFNNLINEFLTKGVYR